MGPECIACMVLAITSIDRTLLHSRVCNAGAGWQDFGSTQRRSSTGQPIHYAHALSRLAILCSCHFFSHIDLPKKVFAFEVLCSILYYWIDLPYYVATESEMTVRLRRETKVPKRLEDNGLSDQQIKGTPTLSNGMVCT